MYSNASPAPAPRRPPHRPPSPPRGNWRQPNRGPAPDAGRRDPDMRFNRLRPGEKRGAARVLRTAPAGWLKGLPNE